MSNSAQSDWSAIAAVEGRKLIGGVGSIRTRERTPAGLLYEIRYPGGVGSPPHQHDHHSVIYVLSGTLSGTLDGQDVHAGPGDSLVHPAGIQHSVCALSDAVWLEFKAPLPLRDPITVAQ